ncbi:hypothetical protein [Actinomadura hibisca]|uniref:hypothetical protein n=1 Tax=Actinomadura hibisca TaxID=68565 RepID=UPI0008347D9E|nr:hypothetical protein [Actinomadura hibisca]
MAKPRRKPKRSGTDPADLLLNLPDSEFVDALRRVFAERSPWPGTESSQEAHYVLAVASRVLPEDDEPPLRTGEGWELSAVGYPDPAHYDGDPLGVRGSICQSGRCTTCRTEVHTTSKHGLCPVCGAESYGT